VVQLLSPHCAYYVDKTLDPGIPSTLTSQAAGLQMSPRRSHTNAPPKSRDTTPGTAQGSAPAAHFQSCGVDGCILLKHAKRHGTDAQLSSPRALRATHSLNMLVLGSRNLFFPSLTERERLLSSLPSSSATKFPANLETKWNPLVLPRDGHQVKQRW
jgi:hypothetical protein